MLVGLEVLITAETTKHRSLHLVSSIEFPLRPYDHLTMAALPQFTYIFALGLIFAFLDAWNIGANDVANSFATSVSSRSLTMIQAMTIGAIMEFVGAVLAGYA